MRAMRVILSLALLFTTLHPSSVVAMDDWWVGAMANMELGRCDAAQHELRQVSDADRSPLWFALSAYAHVSCENARSEAQARAVLSEGQTRYPGSSQLIWTEGDILAELGLEDEANTRYEKAYLLAKRHLEEGSGDRSDSEVVSRFNRRSARRGGTDVPLLNRAAEQLAGDDCAGAIETVTSSTGHFTEEHYVLLTEAYLDCWMAGRNDQLIRAAQDLAKEGARIYPRSSRLLARIAETWIYLGRNDLALTHLEKARTTAARNLETMTDPGEIEIEKTQLQLLNDWIPTLKAPPSAAKQGAIKSPN